MEKYKKDGYILVKVGDSQRDVNIRMGEQGGAAEFEGKIKIGSWNGLINIKRDFEVHTILNNSGLHNQEGAGTEWFKIPATSIDDARRYLDNVVSKLEGRKVRNKIKLRKIQANKLDRAMEIIENAEKHGKNAVQMIANLCPRFGKTIWALMLFNRISEKYNNRVMLLPAYWLGVHGSFADELDAYDEFSDIVEINVNDPCAANDAWEAIRNGQRIVIPVSLHGNLEEWKKKHQWISTIPNEEIFAFFDEGDFGSHTENQREKAEYLFT
jgi:hypothetical protein